MTKFLKEFACAVAVLVVCNAGSLDTREKRDAEDDVCYGPELGCFSNKKPFDNVDVLPSSPEEIDTKFYLYTRENVELGRVFNFTERKSVTEPASGFSSTKHTKFIVHGFTSGCNRQWVEDMKNAILSVDDCNVICVDWRNGAARPDYLQAAANTRVVGKQIALLVKDIRNAFGNVNIHIIAFSLGAHVAGIAGAEAQNITRISGLDPAGPLFESYDSAVRLDKSDALFVDVIHSSGDSLMDGGVGTMSPMGHVDFYPNGGRFQNGCSERFFVNVVRDIFRKRSHTVNATVRSDPYGSSLCNHKRVYKLYTESILPNCQFQGFKCDSFERFLSGAPDCLSGPGRPMGYYADRVPFEKKDDGDDQKFYLVTRGDVPYCANQMLVEGRVEKEQNKTLGKLDIRFPRNFLQAGEPGEGKPVGISEVFRVTRQADHRMESGSIVRKVIPTPPGYMYGVPPTIFVRYTAYKGWFVKGKRALELEAFTLQPIGRKGTPICGSLIHLEHGEEVKLTLKNSGNQLCYELS